MRDPRKRRFLRKIFPPRYKYKPPYKRCQYITGEGFKDLCKFSYDEYGYATNPFVENNYYFVKNDMLDIFFQKYLPCDNFVLISHNSDIGVTEKYLPYLYLHNLKHWYALNVEISHPKLTSIPIGFCNYSDFLTFQDVQNQNNPKISMVYANYRLRNNAVERFNCTIETHVAPAKPANYRQYLKDTSQAYFVISPDGNGVDCYRTWEALYLKAIPIITRNHNSVFYKDLPIIILDSWKDYKNLCLSPKLYEQIWKDYDPNQLSLKNFFLALKPPI